MSKATKSFYYYEHRIDKAGTILIAGVDEVGRGPLAGPVLAAAVIFPPGVFIPGVTDSKQLTSKQRESLYRRWKMAVERAKGWEEGK